MRPRRRAGPVLARGLSSDEILHSAAAWKQKRELDAKVARLAEGPDGARAKLSPDLCAVLQQEVGASYGGCSLVTEISGSPDGCECQMSGKSCPSPPAGFDAVQPSAPVTVGSESVILCMYWYFQVQDGAGQAAEVKVAKDRNVAGARQIVERAWAYAKDDAASKAEALWAATPTPFPREEPPEACDAGELVGNPHTTLKVAYAEMPHGGKAVVQCPSGYSGTYRLQCWDAEVAVTCDEQITLGGGYVTCCKMDCPEYKKVIVPQSGSGTGWGYFYSLGATVDVPKMRHGQQLQLDCPKGWAGSLTYTCAQGSSGVSGQCGAITPNWSQWQVFPGLPPGSPFTAPPTTVAPQWSTTPSPALSTTTPRA